MSKKFEHTSPGGIVYNTDKKLGYYLFNNEIYYSKYQVLLAASKDKTETNLLNNEKVKWFYNEDVFLNYPWHIEPEESIEKLYCARAQQLRDSYDYIRIEASGGSDSTTAIYSFLLNGIHLDEVVFRFPKTGAKDFIENPWDSGADNILSEYNYAVLPLFNWIKTHHPKTKITVHDYGETFLKEEKNYNEDWIYKTKHYLQPSYAFKHDIIGVDAHRDIAEKKKKIAVVLGIDKPKICIKDQKFFLYFSDMFTGQANPDGRYDNVSTEFFFWTPNMPEIVAKQAHMVKNWFSLKENHKFNYALYWENQGTESRTLYENVVKAIIYPNYDLSTFQVKKPSNNINSEMDYWFHVNFQGTRIYDIWKSSIDRVLENLDPKYVSKNISNSQINIKEFTSMFYYFGDNTVPVTGPMVEFLQKAKKDARKFVHCIRGQLSIY